MKDLNYNESNEFIRHTYFEHMTYLNFTFSEVTYFLIDFYNSDIQKSLIDSNNNNEINIDKIIVCTILAKIGIENNQINDQLLNEVKAIDSIINLYSIKKEFDPEEFEALSNDFEEVKSILYRYGDDSSV